MKKTSKIALKTIGAAAGVTLGLCECIYEGVLNGKLIKFIASNDLFRDEATIAFESNPENVAGIEWFENTDPTPTATIMDNGDVCYSYIAKQEKPTNLWAVCNHGYSADPKSVGNLGKHYFEQGYNVLFPCMRAHSLDQNKYCSMGFYDKNIVCTWIKYIVDNDPTAEIIVHGISMGSATTMLVTGEDIPENVKCAVADCGYTTCWDEYSAQIGEMFHLPAFPFLNIINGISVMRGNFNFKKCAPIEAVAVSHTPTLFIHGEEDTFVPYSMLDRLYNACSAEKDKLSVPDAFHAVSSHTHPDMYWNKVDEFKAKYIKEKVTEK